MVPAGGGVCEPVAAPGGFGHGGDAERAVGRGPGDPGARQAGMGGEGAARAVRWVGDVNTDFWRFAVAESQWQVAARKWIPFLVCAITTRLRRAVAGSHPGPLAVLRTLTRPASLTG